MNSIIFAPFIGMIIGYFTNWLAIKMIFRPYEEKRILGIKVPFTPGLIAVERDRITEQIGFVVTNHLLTDDAIKNRVLEFDFEQSIINIIDAMDQSIKSNENTFDDLLSIYLKDDYDIKKAELTNLLANKLNEFSKKHKSDEQLLIVEQDIKQVLPDILNVIKLVFENDMYNIDEILIDFFDDLINNMFKSLGPLVSGLIDSNKIYVGLKTKIVSTIDEDYETIENKIIKILYDSNNDENENSDFELINISENIIINILNQKIKTLSPLFEILKNENIVEQISILIKEHLSKETNHLLTKININELIINKMNEMPLSEIENLIFVIAKKEISSITYLGGFLGFIIGLASVFLY